MLNGSGLILVLWGGRNWLKGCIWWSSKLAKGGLLDFIGHGCLNQRVEYGVVSWRREEVCLDRGKL